MNKFLDYLKKNKIVTGVMVAAIVLLGIYAIKSTYSLDNQYVVFQGIDNYRGVIIKSCKIDSSGKLDSGCISEATKVCGSYTATYWGSDTVNLSGTFSSGQTVYCKGGSSNPYGYTWGCYVCPDNPSIIKWLIRSGGYSMPDSMRTDPNCSTLLQKVATITDDKECVPPVAESACYQCKNDETVMEWRNNGNADSKCTGGYNKTNKTQAECKYVAPTSACYQCKTDEKIMEWRTSAEADDKCASGYNKTTKTQAECKYVAPTPTSACYQCKNDEKVMEWRTNGNADSKCTGGYNKTTKTQAECKYVAPTSACYECKADKNILKWKTDAQGDDSCPGGYNKTTKTQANCKVVVPENPTTGTAASIFIIFMAAVSMGLALVYLKRGALSK